ncbi:MAG: translation initiation factor IF-2 [Bacteroidetes bacterium]|nr:translation initiation factor IF-2 [Bacteroidota bacterium]
MAKRSPICSVLGHVDHGKSSILDFIRETSIVRGEAGAITQAIGASIIPLEVIKQKCGKLLEQTKTQLTIPGLLFIDTPGHAAFTSLRKRGGNLADIAILVVDINEGFKPQTIEAIEILKSYKTPFIIAANKIDLLPNWKSDPKISVLSNLQKQNPNVITVFETKLYEIVGQVHNAVQLNSERFDRVDDFTKQIAIVPTSAKTGEGLSELLMVIAGLAQKFLEKCLECNLGSFAKGTVLEVKETKGIGTTMDVIIYDGTLHPGDTVVIGSLDNPIITKIKALLEPAGMGEMRDKKSKFVPVKEAVAATGVKISAPEIDKVIAGMPLRSCKSEDASRIAEELRAEVDEVTIETDEKGIIIKADTLGSLEAMIKLLNEKQVPIRAASIGDVTKKDIADAESNYEKDPLTSVILGFNIKCSDELKKSSESVKVFTNDVIYRLLEDFEKWQIDQKKCLELKALEKLTLPCKIEFMANHTFRQNNPAIIGCDILAGTLKTNIQLMKQDGTVIGHVKSIKSEKDNLNEVEAGKQVAVAIDGPTVGRQIEEGNIFYSVIPENNFRELRKAKACLDKNQINLLKEIAEIMRKQNPVWGV